MQRSVIPVAFLMIAVALVGSIGDPDAPGAPERLIVGFYDDPPVDVGERFHGAAVVLTNDAIDFIAVEAPNGQAFRASVAGDNRALYVQRDFEAVALYVPNDPQAVNQWALGDGIAQADVYNAWDSGLGSSSVRVAVLDSGYDSDHPDLPAPVLAADFTGSGTWEDCQGHGTHVAGTVGAITDNGIGVAGVSQSSIMVGRVLDCSGSGAFSWIANGITWAADNGADVISMSIGCSAPNCFHQATADALAYAEAQGALNVCAAGNSGPKKNSVEFPGNDPGCMAVSNLGDGFLSGSSSTGPEVEIAAPGTDILSTTFDGGYGYKSGTSMAAPHVSGVAALVKAANPQLSGQDIRDLLKATALDTSLDANQEGSGVLKAAAAVAAAPGWTGGGDPPAGGFELAANGYKVQGKQNVDLTWSGGAGGSIDVIRDGSLIATTADDGAYTDAIGAKGGATYVYQVCDAGTSTCSNEVTVVF